MNTDTVTQTAGQGAADFLTVLFAWMFTPTGAVLTLLLLAVGGGSVFMKIMGRSMRMLSVAARICAGLFFVWVISGVLEAMGIPIREWMQGIASQLPDLGVLLKAFLERLLFTASYNFRKELWECGNGLADECGSVFSA